MRVNRLRGLWNFFQTVEAVMLHFDQLAVSVGFRVGVNRGYDVDPLTLGHDALRPPAHADLEARLAAFFAAFLALFFAAFLAALALLVDRPEAG